MPLDFSSAAVPVEPPKLDFSARAEPVAPSLPRNDFPPEGGTPLEQLPQAPDLPVVEPGQQAPAVAAPSPPDVGSVQGILARPAPPRAALTPQPSATDALGRIFGAGIEGARQAFGDQPVNPEPTGITGVPGIIADAALYVPAVLDLFGRDLGAATQFVTASVRQALLEAGMSETNANLTMRELNLAATNAAANAHRMPTGPVRDFVRHGDVLPPGPFAREGKAPRLNGEIPEADWADIPAEPPPSGTRPPEPPPAAPPETTVRFGEPSPLPQGAPPGPGYVPITGRDGAFAGWYDPATGHAKRPSEIPVSPPPAGTRPVETPSPASEPSQEVIPPQAPQTPPGAPQGLPATQVAAAPPEAIPAPAPTVYDAAADLKRWMEQGGKPVTPPALPPTVDEAAHEAATSQSNALPEPTEGQKEAGNYKLGHLKVQGLDISIENPKGSVRSGTGPEGPWQTVLPAHYGYIKRTQGADGDHVDVYVGNRPESPRVFVVDQIEPKTGKFDEHKAILGTMTEPEALALYSQGFSDGSGPSRIGAMTPMAMPEFKAWLRNGDTTKPLAYQEAPPGSPSPGPGEAPAPERGVQPAAPALPEATHRIVRMLQDEKIKPKLDAVATVGRMTTEEARRTLDWIAGNTHLIKKTVTGWRAMPRRSSPMDLATFLAANGGLQDHGGELAAMDLHKKFVPGMGRLVRRNGLTLDAALIRAQEGGYLPQNSPDRPNTIGINDLLDALDRNERGQRVWSERDRQQLQEISQSDIEAEERGHMERMAHALRLDIPDHISDRDLANAIRRAEEDEAIAKAGEMLPEERADIEDEGERLEREAMALESQPEEPPYHVGDDIPFDEPQGPPREDRGVAPPARQDEEAAGARDDAARHPDAGGAPQGPAPQGKGREALIREAERAAAAGEHPAARDLIRARDEFGRAKADAERAAVHARAARQQIEALEGRQRTLRKLQLSNILDAPARAKIAVAERRQALDEAAARFERQQRFDERRSAPEAEQTAQGSQLTLGNETGHISDAEKAQRGAEKPLQPKAPQKRADEGIFDVAGRGQGDLVDLAKAPSKSPVGKKPKKPSRVDRLERYFAPGRIIPSYGGRDRVLSFKRGEEGRWSVRVQAVDQHGKDVAEPPREHMTAPSERDLVRFERSEGFKAEVPGRLVPTAALREKENEVRQAVLEEVNRLAPRTIISIHAKATHDGVPIYGSYYQGVITVALNSKNPIGTARHEVIHALRDLGVITPQEWTALANTARGQWMDRYEVRKRWGDLYKDRPDSENLLLEEAVAEAFADFAPDGSRAWARRNLPPRVFQVFKKLWEFFQRIRARLEGLGFHSLDDAFKARDAFEDIERGEVGQREWGRDPYAEKAALAEFEAEQRGLKAQVPEAEPGEPAPSPGRPAATTEANAGRRMIETAKAWTDAIVGDIQMKTAPMARGSDEARAVAKDYANAERLAAYRWRKEDEALAKNFTPEERARMGAATEEQSVAMQLGQPTEGIGLGALPEKQRQAIEALHEKGKDLWERAKEVGIVQGEGLPSYMPRMLVEIGADGTFSRIGKNAVQFPGLDSPGRNFTTTTANLRSRKHLTPEETEAAGKAKFGAGALLVRDIRALPLAYGRLEKAIAGKALINEVKEIGARTGAMTVSEAKPNEPGWFTIDHPAFTTYRPRLTQRAEKGPRGGTWEAAADKDGKPIFDKVPIYVRSDFEGPLRAVLTKPSGDIYRAMMSLKGKTMSVIMYSPLIHNAVEWGRALPMMPGKVLTLKVYFEGNAAKNDRATMEHAIAHGLVPIGGRFFQQDITDIVNEPHLRPGRSLMAKGLGLAARPFGQGASTTVRRGVDRAGDFWHNTLLWDRVADLQMGIYKNMRDALLEKGLSDAAASRVAAHLANRYAGALPKEAMSEMARKVANFALFSRTFTLGNLGAMKDVLTGLPRDVQAQLRREATAGDQAAGAEFARKLARRKAMVALVLDIAALYVVNSLLQNAFDYLKRDKTLGDLAQGYVDRLGALGRRVKEHPLEALNPFGILQALSSTSENEPGKEDRVHFGDQADGTAIYLRNPTGKIGEDMKGWLTDIPGMVHKKLGTIARPLSEIYTNDRGFGRHVYDAKATGIPGAAKIAGQIVWHLFASQLPIDSAKALRDLATGEGDKETNALKSLGPLAGLTFSKGAPGGPAVGLAYDVSRQHFDKVREAMPDLNRMIARGEIDKAEEQMLALNMGKSEIRNAIRHALDPRTRLSGRSLATFYRYATEEEKARMERLRAGIRPPQSATAPTRP